VARKETDIGVCHGREEQLLLLLLVLDLLLLKMNGNGVECLVSDCTVIKFKLLKFMTGAVQDQVMDSIIKDLGTVGKTETFQVGLVVGY
jgi:hypothetical protein